MKATPFLLSLIAGVLFVVTLKGPCLGSDRLDVLEEFDSYGHINWSKGTIIAEGVDMSSNHRDSGTKFSRSQAGQNPHARLFQVIQKVRINASTLVGDLVKKNEMIGSQLMGMVRLAKPVKREFVSIGMVETTFAIDMTGGLAQLALPKEIKSVPEIKRIFVNKGSHGQNRRPEGPAHYSGLVFDAGGLDGVPAMVPKIISETGEVVYGPAYVSREFAVQLGMATFERDLDAGIANPRVEGNPLTIKCLKAKGIMPCDFVISNADASRIRGMSENLMLLRQCKVVIVLD